MKHWVKIFTLSGFLFIFGGLLFSDCGSKKSTQPSKPEKTESADQKEKAAPEATTQKSEAEEEKVVKVAAGDPEKGKKLYESSDCVTCHGIDGKGNGPAAAGLNPKPRDFTDKSIMSKLTDEHIAKTIKEGGAAVGKSPLMPAHPQFSDEEIRNLVAYVRTLAK